MQANLPAKKYGWKDNNASWFSNVAIVMDETEDINYITDQGVCFGKVGIAIF